MRSGGATAAANAKVPDQIFKRHGHWKSENSKDGFVEDSLESRFVVSKNIGLYLTLSDTAFFVALCVLLANHCGGTTPLKSYVGERDMYVYIRVCDLGMM